MTIPNDSLNRSWIEVAGANPGRLTELRPSLITFMAFGPGRAASLAGTGFVIDAAPEFAVVLTAKHVLSEGIARSQRTGSAHAPSALFVPAAAHQPSIDPQKLRAVWMGSKHADMMNVAHIGYNETLDIACCVITPQEQHVQRFRPVSIPIDTVIPQVGTVVHMVSLDDMKVDEVKGPSDFSGMGQMLSVHRRVSIRLGKVTGVYPKGFRQYCWPCFTTSIPAEPGMSGGFVYLAHEGKTISACGVVSADNSLPGARSDQFQCGESVIASTWPALALRLPDTIPSAPETPTYSLYKFMRDGRMLEAVGGIEHIDLVDHDNGDFTIGLR